MAVFDCTMNLNQKRWTKKRLTERNPASLAAPVRSNYSWSFDFMSNVLYNDTRFRVLNIIDEGTRESLPLLLYLTPLLEAMIFSG